MIAIEEYKVEEVKGELDNVAADVNAIEIIKSLGLTGQEKLVNTETLTRVSFRRMTEVEREVYSLLFPEKTRVELFDSEIIPVRVLELLKEATDSKMFVQFQVWHARTKKEDPVLVGVVGKPSPQTWDQNYLMVEAHHLIARWGDALLPFDKLLAHAKSIWTNNEKNRLKEAIHEAQGKLDRLSEMAETKFASV